MLQHLIRQQLARGWAQRLPSSFNRHPILFRKFPIAQARPSCPQVRLYQGKPGLDAHKDEIRPSSAIDEDESIEGEDDDMEGDAESGEGESRFWNVQAFFYMMLAGHLYIGSDCRSARQRRERIRKTEDRQGPES